MVVDDDDEHDWCEKRVCQHYKEARQERRERPGLSCVGTHVSLQQLDWIVSLILLHK